MPPIATNSIWFENHLQLTIRWFDNQSSRVQEQAVSPNEALLRCQKRSSRVLDFSKLEESRQLKTMREWETRWDRKKEWKRLKDYLDAKDVEVVRHKDEASFSSLTSTALEHAERESIILVDEALIEIRQHAEDAGLSIPLTTEDIAVFELGYEIYHYLVSKIGNEARDWTEEIASHLFVERLLGLPFNLFVLSFIPSSNDSD